MFGCTTLPFLRTTLVAHETTPATRAYFTAWRVDALPLGAVSALLPLVGERLPARSIVAAMSSTHSQEALVNHHVSAALAAVKTAEIVRSNARKRRCAK
jgi:hypothetical protein